MLKATIHNHTYYNTYIYTIHNYEKVKVNCATNPTHIIAMSNAISWQHLYICMYTNNNTLADYIAELLSGLLLCNTGTKNSFHRIMHARMLAYMEVNKLDIYVILTNTTMHAYCGKNCIFNVC